MATKSFTAKMSVDKFNEKGDLVRLEPLLTKGGIKSTWFDRLKVESQCGKLKLEQKLTLTLSAD